MSNRLPKDFYYLRVAEAVSCRSTCLSKQWGAVIVRDDSIVSTGYNGAPRGTVNCSDQGACPRLSAGVQRGTNYNMCVAVHAEANAIISAPRDRMLHATLYLYGYDMVHQMLVQHPDSCPMCKRLIINSGIEVVCVAEPEDRITDDDMGYRARRIFVSEWINAPYIHLRDNCGY